MKIKLLKMGLLCSIVFFGNPPTTIASTMGNTISAKAIFIEAPVALSADNVRNYTFGANWEPVSGATEYRIDVSTTPFGETGTEQYVYENLYVENVTYYTVTNLNPGTPYYYRVRAVSGTEVSPNSNTISTFTTAITLWDGANWSDGAPTAAVNAEINGAYDTATSGSFTAASLTINTNGSLIVRSGNNMTVVNAITNNANATALTVENNANLLQIATVNTNNGAITIDRNADMRRLDYVYWSSPVTGQNLELFSPQTLANRFYTLDEATNSFMQITPETNNFTTAKGYVIRAPNTFTTAIQTFNGHFTGVPNNGTITIPMTFDGPGFNLIGNPYPSTIDAEAFLNQNQQISTLYFWTHTQQGAPNDANYATVNATGEASASTSNPQSETPNGTIQTGQGFVAEVNAAGNAVFLNTMRVVNNEDQFFRTSEIEKNRLWLSVSNSSGMHNQVVVGYVDGATNGTDNQYDGKLIEINGTRLYSTIADSTVPYVIQGKALPFANTDSVALGFTAAEAGTYTIAMDNYDGLFATGQDVFLTDNLTGTTVDIKAEDYNFASDAGNFANRFTVLYQNSTLGIDVPQENANNVIVYTKASNLYIHAGNGTVAAVNVFDVSGRLLYSDNGLDEGIVTINTLQTSDTMLLVQVTTANGQVTTKKILF